MTITNILITYLFVGFIIAIFTVAYTSRKYNQRYGLLHALEVVIAYAFGAYIISGIGLEISAWFYVATVITFLLVITYLEIIKSRQKAKLN